METKSIKKWIPFTAEWQKFREAEDKRITQELAGKAAGARSTGQQVVKDRTKPDSLGRHTMDRLQNDPVDTEHQQGVGRFRDYARQRGHW